ncbi:MAG: helix-turn-helix transcriptional regulator [Pseudonocardiaceae bacterium]
MDDIEPTIRSRELGDGMRAVMKRADLTGKQTAELLAWSATLLSRILAGKRHASALQVSAFLAVCRVTGTERDQLIELCHEQHTPGWWQQHGSRLPEQLVTLMDHESKAVTISDFQAMIVPGILQTGDYARAVISRIATMPADEIDGRVAARLGRQNLFSREHPARFTFYLHEFALRLSVGDPAVMLEQLDHLLRMSQRPYLTLRVVPAAFGAHAGSAGSFMLMEFADFKPVAYLENETSCLFLEQAEEIAAYRSVLRALARAALSEEESRELIARLATELAADREDQDARAHTEQHCLAHEQL